MRLIKSLFIFFVSVVSPAISLGQSQWDFIVSKDGTGNFFTVQQAIDAVPDYRKNITTIFVKPGVYKEKLVLPASKTNVHLVGEAAVSTIITFDDFGSKKNIFGEEMGTTGSSSFFVFGDGFEAESITFENSSGPVGQAVAVRIDGDKVKFTNCRFLGFQDTLYPHGEKSRQYYKNCYIEGTVDFIFGWSTAVFEDCTIFCKKGGGYITAASTLEETAHGFVFINCKITGDAPPGTFYLGRPWRPFAKTVFINCELEKIIKPEGWHNWNKPDAEKKAFYGEYRSSGAGASPGTRVSWSKQLTDEEANALHVSDILKGSDNWDPAKTAALITNVRDTSFTTISDYQKTVKKFPFIRIVPDSVNGHVREQRDLVYCSEPRPLHIDAFFPSKSTKPTAAVIIVHGGGWRSGSREQHIPLAQRLAMSGYAAYTVEYRLSPEALSPAAINDVKTAVRWVRANAKTFNVDTAKIAIAGFSAGGQLAALAGVTSGLGKFEEGGCNKEHSSDVNAVVDIDGTLSFVHPEASETKDPLNVKSSAWWLGYRRTEVLDVWQEASPLTYAKNSTVPFLFLNSAVERMHAGRDDFKSAMDKKNVYTEIVTFGNTPHTFCLYHPWFNETVTHIDSFLKKVFKVIGRG